MILYGNASLHRDRPSLHWPVVPGVMMQIDVYYHSGRNAHYSVQATYTYIVNGTRHVSHQICLWSPDLSRAGNAESFAKAHRAHTSVDVYYDPRNPDNAVLIPGADEFLGKSATWGGGFIVILSTLQFIKTRKEYSRVAAECREEAAKMRGPVPAKEIKPLKSDISSQSFLSYEPACKRKLNCFPDKECLLEVLGHDGKKLQDWEPDDRVIDSSGHVYRLVYRPQNKWYDIEPTDETWDYPKILEMAVEDAQLIKKDPKALRDRVDCAPDTEKITVIMQCVDDLPSAPVWVWIGVALLLLLFFLAVLFGGYYLITGLQNRFHFSLV